MNDVGHSNSQTEKPQVESRFVDTVIGPVEIGDLCAKGALELEKASFPLDQDSVRAAVVRDSLRISLGGLVSLERES